MRNKHNMTIRNVDEMLNYAGDSKYADFLFALVPDDAARTTQPTTKYPEYDAPGLLLWDMEHKEPGGLINIPHVSLEYFPLPRAVANLLGFSEHLPVPFFHVLVDGYGTMRVRWERYIFVQRDTATLHDVEKWLRHVGEDKAKSMVGSLYGATLRLSELHQKEVAKP